MYTPQAIRFDTPIRLQRPITTTVNGAAKITGWEDLAYQDTDHDIPVIYLCEWKNQHGQEAVTAGLQQAPAVSTVTLWYVAGLDSSCRVLLRDKPYEIVGEPDDVENRHMWHVLRVKRWGKA